MILTWNLIEEQLEVSICVESDSPAFDSKHSFQHGRYDPVYLRAPIILDILLNKNKRTKGPEAHRIKFKFAKAHAITLILPFKVIQGQTSWGQLKYHNDLLYVILPLKVIKAQMSWGKLKDKIDLSNIENDL